MQLLERLNITEHWTSVNTRHQRYGFVKARHMTLCYSIEDLTVSLLIPNVGDTGLTSDVYDRLDEGWRIILTHIGPCEVPVLNTWGVSDIQVDNAVAGTAAITEPNIIAGFCNS